MAITVISYALSVIVTFIRPRQQAATPSLREEYLFYLPQRGPRLEGELASRSTASRSAFDGKDTAPPLRLK